MANSVRVRFAPSPTGYLHVGGARTALFNYLFAASRGGTFILRIEDTDRERFVPGSIGQIMESLRWLGITWTEGPDCGGPFGPYIQSERKDIYNQYAKKLLDDGNAYYCFCSAEELNRMREEQKQSGKSTRYDGRCQRLSPEEIDARLRDGVPYVVRMKTPDSGDLVCSDCIHGEIVLPYENVDDQVLVKSDGLPTYHLANVVDDHFMEITHVIRGDEWRMSLPKHVLLYQYLGWEPPRYAHVPLLLNPDGSKLSKRQGDVAVTDYRRKGYVGAALVNFLSLLGWSCEDGRELLSLFELESLFSLDRVGKSGAVFDMEKLNWMNGRYIRDLVPPVLAGMIKPFMLDAGQAVDTIPEAEFTRFAGLVREYLVTLADAAEHYDLYFNDTVSLGPAACEIAGTGVYRAVVDAFARELEACTAAPLDEPALKDILPRVRKAAGVKWPELYKCLRAALTGRVEGVDIGQLMLFLGKDRMLARLKSVEN